MSYGIKNTSTPKMSSKKNPLFNGLFAINSLFLLYVVANIYAFVSSVIAGHFVGGDFEGFLINETNLTASVLLVLVSYLSVYLYVRWVRTIVPANNNWRLPSSTFIGCFVFLSQTVVLYFVLSEGAFVSGSTTQPSFVTYFSTLLVPDYLFLIYFCLYRKNTLLTPNLLVYLGSTLFRGLLGGITFLIFMEFLWICRNGLIHRLKIIALVGLIITPFAFEMRTLIRSSGAIYLLNTSPFEIFSTALASAYSIEGMLSSLEDIFQFFLMRLQHLSSVAMIFENPQIFRLVDLSGLIAPFYSEGAIQNFVLGSTFAGKPGLQEFLMLQFFNTEFGSWYIHPGLAGWFLVNPFTFVLLVAYIAILILASFLLADRLGGDRFSQDCVSLFVLIFICNCWFGPFNQIIQALIILLCANYLYLGVRKFVKYAVRPRFVAARSLLTKNATQPSPNK